MLTNLITERDKLASDIETMRKKLKGYETAIKALQGIDSPDGEGSKKGGKRGKVKDFVLSLIKDAGSLTVAEVVAKASQQGRDLDKQSTASLLSRLKREGTVSYEDNKYSVA